MESKAGRFLEMAALGIDLPAFAVSFAEQLVRGFVVCDLEVLGIPIEKFSGSVGEVAEKVVLDEGAGVVEIAERFSAIAAGLEPFVVVSGRRGNRLRRRFEVLEFGRGAEDIFSVVGDEDSFFADEGHADAPFVDDGVVTDEGLEDGVATLHTFGTVVPVHFEVVGMLPNDLLPWGGGDGIGVRAM